MQAGRLGEALARVVAHPKAAVIVAPSGHKDCGGLGGIDEDVVEYQAVDGTDPRKAMPGCASVQRFIEPAVQRAQVEMIGMAGNRGECARISTVRTNCFPECLGRWGRCGHPGNQGWDSQRKNQAQEQTFG